MGFSTLRATTSRPGDAVDHPEQSTSLASRQTHGGPRPGRPPLRTGGSVRVPQGPRPCGRRRPAMRRGAAAREPCAQVAHVSTQLFRPPTDGKHARARSVGDGARREGGRLSEADRVTGLARSAGRDITRCHKRQETSSHSARRSSTRGVPRPVPRTMSARTAF